MKLLRLLTRLRYWRLRARRFERDLVEFRAEYEKRFAEQHSQADAERWRNIYREDMFAAAAVFGSRGIVGIQPRNGPAEIPQPRAAMIANPDPWGSTSAIERMEFNTQWVPLGLEKGLSMTQMQQHFLAELAQRKKFNDEPSM